MIVLDMQGRAGHRRLYRQLSPDPTGINQLLAGQVVRRQFAERLVVGQQNENVRIGDRVFDRMERELGELLCRDVRFTDTKFPQSFARQFANDLEAGTLAEVVDVRLVGQAQAADDRRLDGAAAAARTCSMTKCGFESLTFRAVRMSGVTSGAASTRNHGSTLMQCPPTPGPGVRMFTRGW